MISEVFNLKTDLKLIQDIVYKIFVEFDRICSSNNLRYSMEGGTLLGAVKYRDFVPWDDDIDVIMLREDYEKFLRIAPSMLKKEFFLQSYNNVADFPLNYAKLCINDTKIIDYQYSNIEDMNHGLFIDIFPIDNCKTKKARLHRKYVGLLTSSRTRKLGLTSGGGWKVVFRQLISCLPIKKINRIIDSACKKYNRKNTKFRYEICNSTEKFDPLPSNIYDSYIRIPFRDGLYMAIKDYDFFLKSRFGENYMNELPPENARKLSHFHKVIINGVDYDDK